MIEYHSAVKKNEIMKIASKWIELENILSEVIQTPKYCTFYLVCGLL